MRRCRSRFGGASTDIGHVLGDLRRTLSRLLNVPGDLPCRRTLLLDRRCNRRGDGGDVVDGGTDLLD